MRVQLKIALGGFLASLLLTSHPTPGWADNLDTMGVTLFRASHPTLTGAGIIVAQPEAMDFATVPAFEVNPAAVGEPESLFTWISTNGSSTEFTNDLGVESGHADIVGNCFYGPTSGVAPGVSHVNNYEADYFFQYIVYDAVSITDRVINQSFAFFVGPPDQQPIDSAYDDYIYTNGNIFVSSVNGINNGVGPPGTAYNGIGVGAYGVGAVITAGPTLDNGRSKPDIVAPGTETSFTSPYVAGTAAVLLQAAADGDGGADISDAGNVKTIKALLLNGALKPYDWTHTSTAPLDTNYGAGVLNLDYSYQQLAGGQNGYTSQNTVASGSAHPPINSGHAVASLAGWDYESVNIGSSKDVINHYLFNIVSNSTLTATLIWQRHAGISNINNLGLFLYNTTNTNAISSSVSTVDNVQHLYLAHLTPGKYDLQVVTYSANSVSGAETYAVAFQYYTMSPPSLAVTTDGANVILTWPSSPTVYTLQQTSSLSAPATWSNVTATEWITNTTVWTSVPDSASVAFFRLMR